MGKWIKIPLILALCAAFLAGCVWMPPEEPTAVPTSSGSEATETTLQTETSPSELTATEATTESNVRDSQLAEMQDKLQQDQALCAVAYVGYCGGTFAEIQEGFVADGLTEVLPILSEIGEEHFFSNDGSELYLIIPGKDVGLTVMERSMDENTGETLYGDTLYSACEGLPLLLRGNISDIFPNLLLRIEGQGGETLEYCPSLNLRDGMLWAETSLISDMTPYEVLGIYTGPEYGGEDLLMGSWFTEAPNTAGDTMFLELILDYDGTAAYGYGPENAAFYEYFQGSWQYKDGNILCLSLYGGPLEDPDSQHDFYGEFQWEYIEHQLFLDHVNGSSLIYGLEGGSMVFCTSNEVALTSLWRTSQYDFRTEEYIYRDLELLSDGRCSYLIHNGEGVTYAAYEGTWSEDAGVLDFSVQMFSGNNYLEAIVQDLAGSYRAVLDADGWLTLHYISGDALTDYMYECGSELFEPTISYG